MPESDRISGPQLTCLVAVFAEISLVLFLPAAMAKEAGPNAWVAALLGIVGGAGPVAVMLSILNRRHPGRSITQIAHLCLGRWGGKLVSLVLSGFSIFLASLVIRDLMDFSILSMLPTTPPFVIGLLFTAAVTYTVYNGSEVIARFAVVILILLVLSALLIPLSFNEDFHPQRLLPVVGNGITPIVRAVWPTLGWFGEMWIFGQLLNALETPSRTLRNLAWGLVWAAVLLEVIIVSTILTLTATLTQHFTYPTYALVQQVSVGEFIERLEILLMTLWMSGVMVKAAVCLWVASSACAAVLGLSNHRKLVPIISVLVLALTFIWPNVLVEIWFSTTLWTPIMFPIEIGIPTLLALVSWWRSRSPQITGQTPGASGS